MTDTPLTSLEEATCRRNADSTRAWCREKLPACDMGFLCNRHRIFALQISLMALLVYVLAKQRQSGMKPRVRKGINQKTRLASDVTVLSSHRWTGSQFKLDDSASNELIGVKVSDIFFRESLQMWSREPSMDIQMNSKWSQTIFHETIRWLPDDLQIHVTCIYFHSFLLFLSVAARRQVERVYVQAWWAKKRKCR